MTPDHRLIAAAQRLAGAHVHEVSHQVHLYEGACELMSRQLTRAERTQLLATHRKSEQWLRAFVTRESQPVRTK